MPRTVPRLICECLGTGAGRDWTDSTKRRGLRRDGATRTRIRQMAFQFVATHASILIGRTWMPKSDATGSSHHGRLASFGPSAFFGSSASCLTSFRAFFGSSVSCLASFRAFFFAFSPSACFERFAFAGFQCALCAFQHIGCPSHIDFGRLHVQPGRFHFQLGHLQVDLRRLPLGNRLLKCLHLELNLLDLHHRHLQPTCARATCSLASSTSALSKPPWPLHWRTGQNRSNR